MIPSGALNRADRRLLAGNSQTPADLLIAKMGNRIYLGVRDGGRVRLRAAEARQLAAALLELADDEG